MGETAPPLSRLHREPAAEQIRPGRRGSPGNESRTVLPVAQVLSCQDVSFGPILDDCAAFDSWSPEPCHCSVRWEGDGSVIDHLRCDRCFSLSSTPFPLPLCRKDADVADKGNAG